MVHWRSKFWPPDDACSLKTDGDITVKPVNVMDMTGIFFILGCGKSMTYKCHWQLHLIKFSVYIKPFINTSNSKSKLSIFLFQGSCYLHCFWCLNFAWEVWNLILIPKMVAIAHQLLHLQCNHFQNRKSIHVQL